MTLRERGIQDPAQTLEELEKSKDWEQQSYFPCNLVADRVPNAIRIFAHSKLMLRSSPANDGFDPFVVPTMSIDKARDKARDKVHLSPPPLRLCAFA